MKNHKVLSSKEDLKIFMSPLRQELLRVMGVNGSPMTAKAVADRLHISASSAQHHIRKLMSLGLIEQHHTESINGIQAVFFNLTQTDVSIGYQLPDGLHNERNIISQNILRRTFERFIQGTQSTNFKELSADEIKQLGDMFSGIVYLKPQDARQLFSLVTDFISAHSVWTEGTNAYEYVMIAVNSTALENGHDAIE